MPLDKYLQAGATTLEAGGGVFSALSNINQGRLNRKFQSDLSNTAHQREVRDLLAAGINPILTAGGQGASTPSGSMASTSNPFTNLSHSARSYIQSREEVKNAKVSRASTMALTAKLMAERRLTNATTATETARAANFLQHSKLMTEQEVSQWLDNRLKGSEVDWMEDQGSGKSLAIVKGEQEIALRDLKRALAGGDVALQKWEIEYGQKMRSFSPWAQAAIQAIGGAALAKHLSKHRRR